MLQLANETPFPSQLGLFADPYGCQTASTVLKATLTIPTRERTCRPAPQQLPVFPAPIYIGDPGSSSIRYPADLVPTKPGTDVVFVGHAYTPGRRHFSELEAVLQVGSLRKSLAVIGDRTWNSTFAGAVMSRPVPFVRLPIVYERAYGGTSPSQWGIASPEFDERNPVGTGYCVSRRNLDRLRLPNLEDPQDRIESWRHQPPIAGLGAIDAHWLPRRRLAGTHGTAWWARRYPILPYDFDVRFHCVGNEGLSSTSPMRGELNVALVHLAVHPVLRFRLPAIRFGMEFKLAGRVEEREANLWTIIIEPDQMRVVMVWGASCRIGSRPSRLRHVGIMADGI